MLQAGRSWLPVCFAKLIMDNDRQVERQRQELQPTGLFSSHTSAIRAGRKASDFHHGPGYGLEDALIGNLPSTRAIS